MGAYEGLNAYFENHLCDYAIKYGYADSNILILEGKFNDLKQSHLDIYKNLLSCRHHSDSRSPLQYGQDLVASWVFEDYFLEAMQMAPFFVEHSGADRNRIILPNQKTSTVCDYVISNSRASIHLELVNDYTGFWARTHTLHLRDNKYHQLKKDHCLLLAISLTKNLHQFAIFDFRNDIPAHYIQNHRPYGYKPAYELEVAQDKLVDLSIDNVISEISFLI